MDHFSEKQAISTISTIIFFLSHQEVQENETFHDFPSCSTIDGLDELLLKPLRHSFRTAAAIQSGGDNASGISGSFSARIQAFQAGMLQRALIPGNAHGGTGAGFTTYQLGVCPGKAAPLAVKQPQAIPHPPDDFRRQKFMEGMGHNTRMIAGGKQGRGNAAFQEIRHLLRRGLLHAASGTAGSRFQ